jgi:glutamyl-Q tRNA(Asp) synthetase
LPRSSTGTGTTAEFVRPACGPQTPPGARYRGRFAPSPTGPLHFGSLLAAAGSWLDARAAGGDWLLRMEDIDPPREPPGAADEILRALDHFGLWWDGDAWFQSRRREAYDEALASLSAAGWAYPCICSRKDVAEANARLGRPAARRYPGTCRTLTPGKGRRTRVVRVRTSAEPLTVADRLQGEFSQVLEHDVGDFVLRRREGFIAYQLAVVGDNHAQGVTDVVRGIDLLDSTPRQVWLQRLLGCATPRYMHLPVVAGPGGEKLSKQTGAPPVDVRDAPQIAWQVLSALGQDPPAELRGEPVESVWRWGIGHWRPQQLAGVRSIPAP